MDSHQDWKRRYSGDIDQRLDESYDTYVGTRINKGSSTIRGGVARETTDAGNVDHMDHTNHDQRETRRMTRVHVCAVITGRLIERELKWR